MPRNKQPKDNEKKQEESQSSEHEFVKNKKEKIPPARLAVKDEDLESSDEIERMLQHKRDKNKIPPVEKKKESDTLFESLTSVVEKEAIRLGIKKEETKTDVKSEDKEKSTEKEPKSVSKISSRYDSDIRQSQNTEDFDISRAMSSSLMEFRVRNPDDVRDINSVIVLFISPSFIPIHKAFNDVLELRKFIRNPKIPPEFKDHRVCILETFSDLDNTLFKSAVVNGQRTFFCPIESCKETFKTISLTKRHYLKHADIKPFKCTNPYCDKYFSRKDNQQLHSKRCKTRPPEE